MSIRRFPLTFLLTLVLPCIAYAAVPSEHVRASHRADSQHDLSYTKELSRMPGGPLKFEKFLLNTFEASEPSPTPSPTPTETIDSNAKEKPEAAPLSDKNPLNVKVNLNVPQQPLFTLSARRLTLIDKTYLDAYTILRESNSCSQFFGGPRVATGVLNSLHPRLKKESLSQEPAGISMFGPITNVTDFQTGVSYRLFEKALVNQMGPFYQSLNFRSQGYFHNIGHFAANTREARVSMLLHELGHLMTGANGRWLLPDDGGNEVQSALNTGKIMDKCSEQIKALNLQRNDTQRSEASAQKESEPLPVVDKEPARDGSSGRLNRDAER